MFKFHFRTTHYNEDVFIYNRVFNEEYANMKSIISQHNISEIEIYSTCLGLSRHYLKKIGTPPDYQWFYQAVFDMYVGDLINDGEMYKHANQYLLSLH